MLNRLSLVSFVDLIEIGEDNAINFVFNNMETLNLMQAIVDSDKNKESKTSNVKILSMGKLLCEHLENTKTKLVAGGVF